jgi:hypothetical protein
MEYQREMLAFEEKIALAELEESKAGERVREIKYHKARFNLEYFQAVMKAQQQAQQAQQPAQAQVQGAPNAGGTI